MDESWISNTHSINAVTNKMESSEEIMHLSTEESFTRVEWMHFFIYEMSCLICFHWEQTNTKQ